MNYEESIAYLDSLIKFGIKFGLERMTELCNEFGNPQRKYRVLQIGGTNGKGSTCAFASSILTKSGYKVGSYYSPYVNDPRERIQLNGEMISRDDFADIITRIAPAIDRISATAMGCVTEFEAKTLAALLYFAEKEVDIAVLEVGMGGRFDATSVVQPAAAVITNVTLDHTERLGNTIEKIAFEKAGIIKTGATVITASQHTGALEVISRQCREVGAGLWRVIPENTEITGPAGDMQTFYSIYNGFLYIQGKDWSIGGLKPSLHGDFQFINAATAAAAVISLSNSGIETSHQSIVEGIADAYIPGRLEIVKKEPLLVIDGAHNQDAARRLALTLRKTFNYEKLILVIGMLNTHSPEDVLSNIAPGASKIIATRSKWFKARDAAEIAECAANYCSDIEIIDQVPNAVKRALEISGPRDLILVTGSFYTIGEVPDIL